MQKPVLYSALLALSGMAGAMAQEAAPTIPLNQAIGAAQSAAAFISSADARETAAASTSSTASTSASSTTPSSTSPTAAATTSSAPTAAASTGGIDHRTLIIAVVCAVVGALLVALLVGLCCCCLMRRRRHRRKQARASIGDEEVKSWRLMEPANPGHQYSPPLGNTQAPSAEQQPMIPAATKEPEMRQHPAFRTENPFVPVPPTPRKAPNSRAGLTDGTVPGEAAYIVPETQKLRKSPSQSRSRSRSRSRARAGSNNLPTTNTASRPSTPFGLSGIGQPYEDMHVHVLQTDSPSQELRQSLQNREPIHYPTSEPVHRYNTPPLVPSRSPNRLSSQSYDYSNNNTSATIGTTNTTTDASSTEESSTDDWRYNKQQTTFGGIPPWEQRQNRYSNSPTATTIQAPPIPWQEREHSRQSPSHSPRHSRDWPRHSGGSSSSSGGGGTQPYVNGARRNSRSPATSINGQPRRLRFSDLQADEVGDRHRYSQGVGEAL
ncbi:MAG: hypothetical protein Q9190_008014 [Brigantiaea leucoxantha]